MMSSNSVAGKNLIFKWRKEKVHIYAEFKSRANKSMILSLFLISCPLQYPFYTPRKKIINKKDNYANYLLRLKLIN